MLTISTLGELSILLDGDPVTGLASRKAEALLVYLACTDRPRPLASQSTFSKRCCSGRFRGSCESSRSRKDIS